MIFVTDTMDVAACVLALGTFDGVHHGHWALLKEARKIAREKGVPLAVQTFAQDPLCVLRPGNCPPLLSTPEERAKYLEGRGVDLYYAPPFTPAVRDQTPETFVRELVKRWHPTAIVVGFNYTFGKGGQGTPALLKKLGKQYGFSTVVAPAVRYGNGQPISATYIRTQLAEGRVLLAHLLLGRLYEREVRLTARSGERCVLQWAGDGKQGLPRGTYYALLAAEGHAYPVTVRVTAAETLLLTLPERAALRGCLTLRLIEEKAEPLPKRRKK